MTAEQRCKDSLLPHSTYFAFHITSTEFIALFIATHKSNGLKYVLLSPCHIKEKITCHLFFIGHSQTTPWEIRVTLVECKCQNQMATKLPLRPDWVLNVSQQPNYDQWAILDIIRLQWPFRTPTGYQIIWYWRMHSRPA